MFSSILCFVLLSITGGIFADENAECPSIITRQEWSIMPPVQSINSLNIPVNYAIISHTAGESCYTRHECALRTRLLQVYQVEALGFDDISYSFLIGGDGNVYEGRGWTKQGAHTSGWNNKSIGISFIGTFNDNAPNQAMLNAARKLLTCGKANGALSNDFKVLGHRQILDTRSPGEQLYNIIQTWPEWVSLDALKNDSVKNILANDETVSGLRFIERQSWAAQPPSDNIQSLTLPVHYAIISHTASSPCNNQTECVVKVRIMQTLHMENYGWEDIGYSFLIGGDGNVYVGRGWNRLGGHTFGWNNKSLGIAFIGTFNDVAPSQKMLTTARKLLAFGKAAGYLSNDLIVLGHRQVSQTLSPGQRLYNIIQTWPEWKFLYNLKANSIKYYSANLVNENCPNIISRQQWFAQPPTNAIETINLPVPYVIISHTATPQCNQTHECIAKVRLVHTYHIDALGWSDIAYAFLIGGDGNVYEGRGWTKHGGHTSGWNDKSLGIAFIGTFTNDTPSQKMLTAARKLLAYGKANGKLSNNLKVLGHRQVANTLSPGDQLYAAIKTWPEWISQI